MAVRGDRSRSGERPRTLRLRGAARGQPSPQLAAVGRHGPDHEDVRCEEQRTERVVGDEQEVGMALSTARMGPPARARPTDNNPQPAKATTRPRIRWVHPGGGVELEQIVAGGHIELVLEDADEPGSPGNPTMIIMIAANKMNKTAVPLVSSRAVLTGYPASSVICRSLLWSAAGHSGGRNGRDAPSHQTRARASPFTGEVSSVRRG